MLHRHNEYEQQIASVQSQRKLRRIWSHLNIFPCFASKFEFLWDQNYAR